MRDSLGWPKIPTSIISFQEICVAVDDRCNNSLMWRIVAAVGWELWKSRNGLVFSNIIVIKSPKQVTYKAYGFLKQWIKLSKTEDRNKMEATLLKMEERLSTW